MRLVRHAGGCGGFPEEAHWPLPCQVDRNDNSRDCPNDASDNSYIATVQDLRDSKSD